MQATALFEEQWLRGTQRDPAAFAAEYPELPSELLIRELRSLAEELSGASDPALSDLKLLGRGGMGEVFEGQDPGCRRSVAIKKIRSDLQEHAEVRRRFRFEAELTASLEHPGVIPVYSTGVDPEGRDYYTMRLIRGTGTGTLADAIRDYHTAQQQNTILPELIRHLIDVADTIAYAHHQGIVHRDLKPSNILIGAFGETLIADWGLARRVSTSLSSESVPGSAPEGAASDDHSVTQGVGTPGYAAPELTESTSEPMLRAADIYSLGAVLHCILTGDRPGAMVQPSSPGSVKGRDRVLAAVSRRAMSDSPKDRYASAEDFREDLKRWIAGLPTAACPEHWWERVLRWPGRHRAAAAGLAGAFGILFFGGAIFLSVQAEQNQKLEVQGAELRDALNRAQTLLDETRRARAAAEKARSFAEKSEALAYRELERFQQLMVASNQVFQIPGLQAFQRELSKESLREFNALLNALENEKPVTLRSIERITETAQRLASIEGSLGSESSANSLLDHVCTTLAEMHQRQSQASDGSPRILNLHIGILRSLQGNLLMRNAKSAHALPILEESVRLLDPLLTDGELSREQAGAAATGWLNALSALAVHEAVAGDPRKAEKIIQPALLPNKVGDHASFKFLIAKVQFQANRSIIAERNGEISSAIEQLAAASGFVEDAFSRLSEAPGAAESESSGAIQPSTQLLTYRSRLAHDRVRLLLKSNRTEEGVALLTQLLEQEFETLRQMPRNTALQEMSRKTVESLHAQLIKLGRIERAFEVAADWISAADVVLQQDDADASSVHFAVQAHHHAGHLNDRQGRGEEAFAEYSRALEICRGNGDGAATNPANLSQQVELEIHRVQLRLLSGRPEEVTESFRGALDAATRLKFLAPKNASELAAARRQLQRGLDSMNAAGYSEATAALKEKVDEFAGLR